jgi:L-lactate dehydrogenase complex protein LldG
MTSDDRARMLATLRTAVGAARLPGAELTHPGRFDPPAIEPYDLVDRFRRELTTLGGTVHDADDAAGVVSIIQAIAAGVANPSVLMWSADSLPVPHLGPLLASAGFTLLTQAPETARDADHRRLLASSTLGLTGADAGLAQTGSIVLSSGPGRGRLASLLPPVHVALLERHRIVSSLPELIARRPELVTSGANFVCITGPSRTADIEHVLARGVHGPRDVHVVLL